MYKCRHKQNVAEHSRTGEGFAIGALLLEEDRPQRSEATWVTRDREPCQRLPEAADVWEVVTLNTFEYSYRDNNNRLHATNIHYCYWPHTGSPSSMATSYVGPRRSIPRQSILTRETPSEADRDLWFHCVC